MKLQRNIATVIIFSLVCAFSNSSMAGDAPQGQKIVRVSAIDVSKLQMGGVVTMTAGGEALRIDSSVSQVFRTAFGTSHVNDLMNVTEGAQVAYKRMALGSRKKGDHYKIWVVNIGG